MYGYGGCGCPGYAPVVPRPAGLSMALIIVLFILLVLLFCACPGQRY